MSRCQKRHDPQNFNCGTVGEWWANEVAASCRRAGLQRVVGGGRGQCAVAGNEVYLWQKLRWHELLGIETHHRQDFRAYRETC